MTDTLQVTVLDGGTTLTGRIVEYADKAAVVAAALAEAQAYTDGLFESIPAGATLAPARVAATSNYAASYPFTGLPGDIDGVTLADGDTLLLTAQSAASRNGPWVVSASAWSRPTGYMGAVPSGKTIEVLAGDDNALTTWEVTGSGTVDTNTTTWTRLHATLLTTDAADGLFTAAIATAQAAAPATIKESAGPHGHVYTLGWQVSGDEGVSGLRGLILSRDVAEYPVGVTLRSDDAGGPVWDTIAIDATTTNLVLAYSHLKASGSSDMIRGDIESHWTISDTAGVPDNTVRLNLESTAGDNATTATLLKLSVASGSPINAAGKYLINADVAGVRVLDVTKDGYAAFGFAYSGTLAGGALETKNGAVIRATDTNPTLWLARRGTVTADWVLRVVSTGSGQLELLDNASGRRPLIFRTTAPDATIYADTAGLVLSPSGGKIGFMGATPVARRATTADATDLASVITLANALKADLVALGLKS
jgi:hypothetical protein